MTFCDFQLPLRAFLLLLHTKALLSASKMPAVEIDLDKGLATPSGPSIKSQVTLIHRPTPSSRPGLCDGQALVRLDFSGPYKKARIELIYGGEPHLWTTTISDTEMSYGFGSNHEFTSNCASVQVYNRQFRVYSNKLPGFKNNTINGNTLMAVVDDTVEKGTNMTIDISDETVLWKMQHVNSTKKGKFMGFYREPYLFTLSGQASIYGPPTDTFVYAGFNRVPYGSFHNGSGLCQVRITFKRDLGKGSLCTSGTHDCNTHAICLPTRRAYKCICKAGFHGDGRNCKEYDPCSIDNGGCHHICHNTGGRVSCSCKEGFKLHPNMRHCLSVEEIITISKKVRVKLNKVTFCENKEKESRFLAKLQQKLLSRDVCNFPCRIIRPQLKCRVKNGHQVVSVTFEVQMDQNVISTSKFCNNTCLKCQMEDRLQKMIFAIRTLTDNSKLNVSVDDQTVSFTRRSLRITKDSNHCHKNKTRVRVRCQPGTYFDIFSRQCVNCSRGSYQPNKSENFCFRCPGNKTTLYSGARDISQCGETICGGNLTAMTGAITSPNYPDPYPKGIECVWNIRCPKGRGLLMLIPNISIPLTKDCSDHLIMRASASPFSKTTYYQCESYSSPVTFISRSKNLYVKFTSRADGEIANGFKMFYVTFEERYRKLVASIVEDGTLYENRSFRRIFKNETLITKILDVMAHPQKFFDYQGKNARKTIPEFYNFVEKKVRDFLSILPPYRTQR